MNTNAVDANTLLSRPTKTAGASPAPAQMPDVAREAQTPRPVQAPEQIEAMRKDLDARLERIAARDTRLSFQLDDDSGRTVIIVRDASTKEVLKQIPSEEMLNVARRLEAHLDESGDASGVLLADEV